MLNIKQLFQPALSSNPQTVRVVGKAAIGATGAVGTTTGKGATLTRTGTGAYTLTFATGNIPASLYADIKVIEDSSTQVGVKVRTMTQTKLTFETWTTAGTPADPPNPSVIEWDLCLLMTTGTR